MPKKQPYNGHPSYEHWNVALWFGNDEGLYNMARRAKSGTELWDECCDVGYLKTADGVRLTPGLVKYAWESLRD